MSVYRAIDFNRSDSAFKRKGIGEAADKIMGSLCLAVGDWQSVRQEHPQCHRGVVNSSRVEKGGCLAEDRRDSFLTHRK